MPIQPRLVGQYRCDDDRNPDDKNKYLGHSFNRRKRLRKAASDRTHDPHTPGRTDGLPFAQAQRAPSMPSPLDTLLRPVHQWVWGDFDRRVRKLLAFAEVETDGGRDILRASELTPDPLLRRLYLEHAIDELHHGVLFRERGAALLRVRASRAASLFNGNPLPGGHGLDDLRIEGEPDHRLLAFLHVAEKSAAGRFEIYRRLVDDDPATRAIFEQI